MQIESMLRRNRAVSIDGTIIRFDDKGMAEVDDAIGAKLLQLHGYSSCTAQPPEAAAEPAEEPAPSSLDTLNAAQLKKLAKERGIEIGDASKKADLIAIIEAAQAEAQG